MASDGVDGLDFGHAQVDGDAGACAVCKVRFGHSYYDVNGARVCEPCGVGLRDGVGTRGSRLLRALFLGGGATIVSALVWYGIRAVTGYELGLIAIGVGLAVGIAVRNGSGRRGGGGYQALAMGLTYTAIALTYIPDVASAMLEPSVEEGMMVDSAPPPDAVTTVIVTIIAIPFAFAVPVAQLFEGGIMGFIIMGIALYEAWKVNQRPSLFVQGPYALAPQTSAAPPD